MASCLRSLLLPALALAFALAGEPAQCPAGSFCPQKSAVPILCPGGQFCPFGSSQPTDCPEKHHCPSNSSRPQQCPAGSFCPIASAAPVMCPLGHFCPNGSSEPKKCPAGYRDLVARVVQASVMSEERVVLPLPNLPHLFFPLCTRQLKQCQF